MEAERTASVVEGDEDEAMSWLSSKVVRCVVRCDGVDGEGTGEGEGEASEVLKTSMEEVVLLCGRVLDVDDVVDDPSSSEFSDVDSREECKLEDDDASWASSTIASLDNADDAVDGLSVREVSMMAADHANNSINSPVLGVLTVQVGEIDDADRNEDGCE